MSEILKTYLAKEGLVIDPAKVIDRGLIVTYLQSAFIANKAFLALAAPTAAERNSQMNKLTKQNNQIMRLLMNELDGSG